MKHTWWSDFATVLAVARWACDTNEITTTDELLYYFEKPWKYPEYHEGWRNSGDVSK